MMLIYPLFVLYFGLHILCFYMAWYHTEKLQGYVDKFDNYMTPPNVGGFALVTLLGISSIAGCVYSWYQH